MLETYLSFESLMTKGYPKFRRDFFSLMSFLVRNNLRFAGRLLVQFREVPYPSVLLMLTTFGPFVSMGK